jgi:HEAT repeat protein
MTGMRRSLGLLVALVCPVLCAPAIGAPVDEISDLYFEGVDLLEKGRDEEALERFTRVLAMQPDNQAAYELWKATEQDIMLELLVKGGQYELVAKRFLDLARLARTERRDDEGAIRELLRQLDDDDVLVRKRAIGQLAAEHGEYAVQYMLPTLADTANEERRVYFMQALTEMDTDVVLPLVAALGSDDAFLRRNVALVLGYIQDPRAAAELTWLGNHDPDQGVQLAAKEAAIKCGSNGNALALFLRLGDDYHHQRANVLRPHYYSDVVWSWKDGGLASTPIPRWLYPDELSKNAYYGALMADANSLDARAGIARAYVSQQARIKARMDGGMDPSGLEDQLAEATVAINSAGIEALDRALSWSVASNDLATGAALCQILGGMASEGTPGLWDAFQSGDGAMAGEAAVALGRIAFESDQAASPGVVAGLGKACGTRVLRLAVVIDGNEARGTALAEALAAQGMVASAWNTGARGLNVLRRIPGVDVIIVADMLPDLTADQVLDEIARDEHTANTPLILVSNDTEKASDMYGERVTTVITGAADVAEIEGTMDGSLEGDRAHANDLAARAARVLNQLARGAGQTDLSPAIPGLVATLAGPPDSEHRPDAVTVPAMHALGASGTPIQVPPLLGVLKDGTRSDEARIAAADAIGDIAGRMGMNATEEVFNGFTSVLRSDASLPVRAAAAKAIGRVQLTPAQRAEVAKAARVDVSE